jgi:hypothetical protein
MGIVGIQSGRMGCIGNIVGSGPGGICPVSGIPGPC